MEITVRVKPGYRRGPVVEPLGDDPTASFLVAVPERALDGKANAAVERALAAHFEVPPSAVTILRGHTARIKRVVIHGVD